MEENKILDSYTVYKEALYYICTLLLPDMEHYLNEEGRFYGRVKSYVDSMKMAKEHGDSKITEQDKENYGKILAIIRNQIKRDFNRLGNRRMSSADRIIILLRWILKIVEVIPLENYKFQKESLTFSRILEHMYDNIRNHSKKDSFTNLTKLIERAINNGEFSDNILLDIDLVHEGLNKNYRDIHKKKKELILNKEKSILNEESLGFTQEINFNEEKKED